MKLYELSVLFHPDLEMNLDAPLAKVKKIITDNGGEIVTEENAGKKRLSYQINGHDFAIYVFMDVNLPTEAVKKVQSTLNITDEVIRYLLVTVDEKIRAAIKESKKHEEQESEE